MSALIEHLPLLSLTIWTPVIGAVVLLASSERHPIVARYIALVFALIDLFWCLLLYVNFDTTTAAMQFSENLSWIAVYNIRYSLGVDGISLPMIILTCYVTLIVILASWRTVKSQVAEYLATFLVMQGMVVGVFCALDAVLFYVFWEGMLIPMYLSIGIWGSKYRSFASIKFFLFTFLGSALMLIAFLYMGMHANSFYIPDFYYLPLTFTEQLLIFLAFLLAFAVKVPMWPMHTWLPDAHTEAPAGGSVVLAALMLKLGAYGFLRFSLPITPMASQYLDTLMIVLSLIAIIYIGFIAIAQSDMKKLIAYSSVAHMGFVTMGCFMIYIIIHDTGNYHQAYMSLEGAMVQMVSHAFGAGAMFLGFGMLYEQIHTRKINNFGGIAHTMPVFASFFMLFAMSNVGLPGTSGFVGEFMVILSAFKASFWIAVFACLTLIIGAAYTLWMFKRVFFGPVANINISQLHDVSGPDWWVFVLLALGILVLGIYPQELLNLYHVSVSHLLDISLQGINAA